MKTRKQGGRFLHHNEGEGPRGRSMSALCYQKGQVKEDRWKKFFYGSE